MNKKFITLFFIALALTANAMPAAKVWTRIHTAAKKGNNASLHGLLQNSPAGAKARDALGLTPLHAAAYHDNIDCMILLLNYGADVNAQDNKGLTPLHCLMTKGYSTKCLEVLLKRGANVRAVTKTKQTPLHRAACRGKQQFIEALCTSGAFVDATDENGWTPLHCAAYYGHKTCAEILIEHGADIAAKTNNRKTPADLAWHNASQKVAMYLERYKLEKEHNKSASAPKATLSQKSFLGDTLLESDSDEDSSEDGSYNRRSHKPSFYSAGFHNTHGIHGILDPY